MNGLDVDCSLAAGIDVNLIVWGKRVELPFAAPGDPASDYTTGGVFGVIKGCGVRLNSSARPYKGTTQVTCIQPCSIGSFQTGDSSEGTGLSPGLPVSLSFSATCHRSSICWQHHISNAAVVFLNEYQGSRC